MLGILMSGDGGVAYLFVCFDFCHSSEETIFKRQKLEGKFCNIIPWQNVVKSIYGRRGRKGTKPSGTYSCNTANSFLREEPSQAGYFVAAPPLGTDTECSMLGESIQL